MTDTTTPADDLVKRLRDGHIKIKALADALKFPFDDSYLLEAADALEQARAARQPAYEPSEHASSGGAALRIADHASQPAQEPELHWQYSHHYTAENIAAIVADLRAVEDGRESIEWMNRDHRTKAGILWRVILALSHEVPTASKSEPAQPQQQAEPVGKVVAAVASENDPAMIQWTGTYRPTVGDLIYAAPPAVQAAAKRADRLLAEALPFIEGDAEDDLCLAERIKAYLQARAASQPAQVMALNGTEPGWAELKTAADTAIVVTWDENRTRILAVTRQDCDGRIVKVIAEAPPADTARADRIMELADLYAGRVEAGMNDNDARAALEREVRKP
jgi:hypothetical protein